MNPSYILLVLLSLLMGSGCTPSQQKTDSMLRREKADTAASLLVAKAQVLATQNLYAKPDDYLDELVLIKTYLRDAIAVYEAARIRNWHNAQLTELDTSITKLNVKLAQSSIEAFELAIDKTLVFKKEKERVENLPVYDNSLAKQGLQRTLLTFNVDLNECCVEKIGLINRFLYQEKDKYHDLITLGHSTLDSMGKLVRNEISEQSLRQRVNHQQQLLDKLRTNAFQ